MMKINERRVCDGKYRVRWCDREYIVATSTRVAKYKNNRNKF